MKKLLSIGLALFMICSVITMPTFAANVETDKNPVIWQDDFSSDKSYSLADTGAVSDGKYVMSDGNRIIKNVSKFASGAYEIEATYNFSAIAKVDGLLRITDDTGNKYACYVDVDGGKMQLREITSGGVTPTSTHELLTVETNKDYKVKLRFSLDSKELEIYINGNRYLTGKALKINADCPNIGRAFDCQVGNSSAQFTIDDLSIKKINWNPLEHESVIFEEDFEGGYGSGYAAQPSGTTGIEKINGSDAFLYSTNRLTTNHTIGKGKITLSLDLTIASISSDSAIIIQSADSNGSPVWRLRVNKSGELYGDVAAAKDATSIGTMNSGKMGALNLNTTYKLVVEYDTETKIMNVYVNGLKRNAAELYVKTNTTNYNRVLDENPDHLGKGNASFYLDNIKITKKQSDSIEKIAFEDFSGSSSIFSPGGEVAGGVMKVSSGKRALQSVSATLVDSASVFGVETDISFEEVENSTYTRGIMAPQMVKESTVYEIFGLYEKNGSLLVGTYMEKDDVASYTYLPLVDDIVLGRAYNFAYTLNLTTKRVHFFIDGHEKYQNLQLYMNPACDGNFVRAVDFNNNDTIGENVINIDNYILYKDKALSAIGIDGGWQSGELSLPSVMASGEAVKWYKEAVTEAASISAEPSKAVSVNAVIPVGNTYDMRTFTFYFPSDESSPLITARGNIVSAEVKNQDASTLYFALFKTEADRDILQSITLGGHVVNNTYTIRTENLGDIANGNYVLKAFYWQNGSYAPLGNCDELAFTVNEGNIVFEK